VPKIPLIKLNNNLPDDPSCDDHHSLADAGEEGEERRSFVAHFAQSHSHDGGKDDQAHDVCSLRVFVRDFPVVHARRC